jgi:SAM-dependent methyltransferase
MEEHYADLLACPKTGRDLQLSVIERFADGTIKTGLLTTLGNEMRYPVTNGIPRFSVDGSYAESFDYEWHRFSRTQIDAHNRHASTRDATASSFRAQTTFSPEIIANKKVIEFGCGAGRFLDIVSQWGGIAIGLDATNAVEVAKRNLAGRKNIFVVQGSALCPPFKRSVCDHGFSLGVLHHTPSPAKGLRGLISVVKPGGLVAVSVYPEGGFYSFPVVYYMRKVINLIERFGGKRLAYGIAMVYAWLSCWLMYPAFRMLEYVPYCGRVMAGFYAYFLAVVIVNRNWRWRVLDAFDAITPAYASTHTQEDVEFWLETLGCSDIRNTGIPYAYSMAKPTSYVATKR